MKNSFDRLLNTEGLICPEPVMMLHSAVREVQAGDVIKVIATDPSTERDIPKFCQFLGHELLEVTRDGEQWVYFIQTASASE
ncbi:MAG: sulfurtransferase TusA [Cellvibrionaceae bacterium]|nr:sulfurtransferase TusA [Cellvibrionaceae bacterium]|tara:strand:- start:40312 stop:40557 length:246 start_codon:yes stop_codon:yes gene_type:complete